MRKLRIKELTIISLMEKSAITVDLSHDVNVICGDNDMGKSCLIKSIYHSLGASIEMMHPSWLEIKPITIMKFEKDDDPYTMFRQDNYFVLFDGDMNILQRFSSVGNGLAPFYEEFFDFRLKLRHATGETLKTPHPSHYFLPFYIDQDAGWKKNWGSFARLSEFKNWRQDIIEYHSGVKPNEYYILKADKMKLNESIKETQREINVLDRIYIKSTKHSNNSISMNIDVEEFKREIEQLLLKLNIIKKEEQKYRSKIFDYNNELFRLDQQIKLTGDAKKELGKDYEVALELEDEIECPMCGTVHDNSFAQRYVIAQDENHCYELLLELEREKKEIEILIAKEKTNLDKQVSAKNEIEALLQVKKQNVKLKDYVENIGRTQLSKSIKDELQELWSSTHDDEAMVRSIESSMKKFIDGDLKAGIEELYLTSMREFLFSLNVHKLHEKDYKLITTTIKENGSDLSRALLAYFYSTLVVMTEYSSTFACPVVIDSPLQNEQDAENSVKILEFIRDKKPEGFQLILGCVDLHSVDFKGNMINLSNKHQLLSKERYDEIFEVIKPIIEKSIYGI